MKRSKWALAGLPAVFGITSAASASLLTIGTWASAPANDSGAPTGTAGSGATGSITLSGTGGESSDVPFTPQSLNVGDSITLTGNAAWITGGIGNIQFRFGMFNTNGKTNDSGFDGFVAEVPNTAVTGGVLAGIVPSSSSAWQATGDHYTITGVNQTGTLTNGGAGVGNPPAPTYNFTMTLTETAVGSYSVLASLVASDNATASDFSWTATGTDATTGAGSSAPNSTFNDFGFFFGSGAGLSATAPNNVVNFSNVSVTYTPVPEPATLGLLAVTSASLLIWKRGKRICGV